MTQFAQLQFGRNVGNVECTSRRNQRARLFRNRTQFKQSNKPLHKPNIHTSPYLTTGHHLHPVLPVLALDLELSIRQELTPLRNLNPSPGLIDLLLNLRRKRNRRHDPITELLMDDGFVSVAVDGDHFVETVDQRVAGGHVDELALVGDCDHIASVLHLHEGGRAHTEILTILLNQITLPDIQHLRQLLDILIVRLRLSVEQGSNPDFVTVAEFGGDIGKGVALLLLGVKEGGGEGWKAGLKGFLGGPTAMEERTHIRSHLDLLFCSVGCSYREVTGYPSLRPSNDNAIRSSGRPVLVQLFLHFLDFGARCERAAPFTGGAPFETGRCTGETQSQFA
ncbi:hypothetical protein G7K_4227-t1 [Saitoella complicata NRRL Y-17804]|uniref:Uncharacterized protein n=1 Tax=Saitoella complicata (strain BCRC 22490 / CBS 7301 / JCM 7358 / NBRC 10748 / NRRL Y-17804) TaxID=698492 RepID=A0A0E9NJN5_SAICN|nr:hypothetical protein G7K_4227-t1 [Saitoella complicata NRRL Y-17804]